MSVTNKCSEQFALEVVLGEHDLDTDVLTAVLMKVGFVFDPAVHATYADISADEIAAGNGYTQKAKNLSTVAGSIVSNKALYTADDLTWTASGGAIESCVACCIINNTHASETVICCIEFGATLATASGAVLTVPLSAGFLQVNPIVA